MGSDLSSRIRVEEFPESRNLPLQTKQSCIGLFQLSVRLRFSFETHAEHEIDAGCSIEAALHGASIHGLKFADELGPGKGTHGYQNPGPENTARG